MHLELDAIIRVIDAITRLVTAGASAVDLWRQRRRQTDDHPTR